MTPEDFISKHGQEAFDKLVKPLINGNGETDVNALCDNVHRNVVLPLIKMLNTTFKCDVETDSLERAMHSHLCHLKDAAAWTFMLDIAHTASEAFLVADFTSHPID